MKIKRFILPLLFSIAFQMAGEILTPDQALLRVSSTSNQAYLKSNLIPEHCLTVNTDDDSPALYIFDKGKDRGFMILSAETAAPPMLGYSDTGNFDPGNMPPQMKSWLEEYSRQISYMRETGVSAFTQKDGVLTDKSAISPLLKTKWNQGTPYNKDCFVLLGDGGKEQSVTGCVATAMAQIMNYFQYPASGIGEISYRHGDSGTYSMNFSEVNFDWENMLDSYEPGSYTAQQADAVANLMKACGYSVKMDYSVGDSGASGSAVSEALIKYFNYQPTITLLTRSFCTYDEWVEQLYNNLANVGPVLYDGSALDGGHSFVCDGYDGNGYFHFNWGWGGMADGYYLTDALNPDEYGIGGAAGGYNLGQQITLGISSKAISELHVNLFQTGNLTGLADGKTIKFSLENSDKPGLQYINPEPVSASLVWIISYIDEYGENKSITKEAYSEQFDLTQGYFIDFNNLDLQLDLSKIDFNPKGSFKVELSFTYTASDVTGQGNIKLYPGYYNYVTVYPDNDNAEVFRVENYPVQQLKIENFEVISENVYLDLPVRFSASFINDGDSQLTRNYSAVFFNKEGKRCFTTENFSITVDGQSTESESWTSVQWYKDTDDIDISQNENFTVRLYDNWMGKFIDEIETNVTVLPEPKDNKVEAVLSLEDAETDADLYIIKGNSFVVSISVKVEKGFFSRPINLDIEVPEENGGYYSVQSKRFPVIPVLSEGEEQILTLSMLFEDVKSDIDYRLQAWSNGETLGKPITVRFDLSDMGIENLNADNQGVFKIFDINGTFIMQSEDKDVIRTLNPGIYIINGTKVILK